MLQISRPKYEYRKDIHNLPASVVLRNNYGKHFTIANFDTLPKADNYLFTMKILSIFFSMLITCVPNFEAKKVTQKDIQNLPTCVALRNHFNIANFDTLPRTEIVFLSHEFFGIRPTVCLLHL